MTFESFCDDGKRSARRFLRCLQSLVDLIIIMTIDSDDFKIECFKFFYVFINVMSKHRFLALSKSVDVKNGDKVVQLFMRSKIGGLPYLAFCQFSVTGKHIRFTSVPFTFGYQR